jgi:hypothetical protein
MGVGQIREEGSARIAGLSSADLAAVWPNGLNAIAPLHEIYELAPGQPDSAPRMRAVVKALASACSVLISAFRAGTALASRQRSPSRPARAVPQPPSHLLTFRRAGPDVPGRVNASKGEGGDRRAVARAVRSLFISGTRSGSSERCSTVGWCYGAKLRSSRFRRATPRQ